MKVISDFYSGQLHRDGQAKVDTKKLHFQCLSDVTFVRDDKLTILTMHNMADCTRGNHAESRILPHTQPIVANYK